MAFLSKKVELALVERGITQREIARKLGISDVRMSKIINGHFQVRAEEMLILSDLLGLDPAEIIQNNEAAL